MSVVGFGLGRDNDVADFYVAFGFGRLVVVPEGLKSIFTYIIEEELRLFSVYKENRDCIINEEDRDVSIQFENRIFTIPKKDE